MRFGRPLPRAFFARPCLEVARDLIGCVLVRRTGDGARLAGRLVEVEAYIGDGSDAGSHSHRGRTPRNATMFGPPGHLYVYLSYGIHVCANLVAEPEGRSGGILMRAIEPLEGLETMRTLRGLEPGVLDRSIAGGPGRLGQAFGLGLDDDGVSAVSGEWTVRAPSASDHHEVRVERTRRIGLSQGAALPYRFIEVGSRWLSRAAPAAPKTSAGRRPRANQRRNPVKPARRGPGGR